MAGLKRAALVAAGLGGALALGACASMSAPRAGAPVAVKGRCADESFPIYFAKGSAELSEPARLVIGSASGRIAGCRITAVDVTGISAPDAPGAPANAELTERRAQVVAQALVAAGLPKPAFDVQVAHSERAPIRSGGREPLSRRTEVVLHARPLAS